MARAMTRGSLVLAALPLAALACAKDPDRGPVIGTGGAPAFDSGLPQSFRWTSTGPLITAKQDATHPIVSVKDPSVVFVDGRWHVFATTANTGGNWSVVYLTFTDWAQADAAPLVYLDNNPPGL